MPIKHIPICPFCGTELKLEPNTIYSDGVILPTVLKEIEVVFAEFEATSGHTSKKVKTIINHITVDAWKCSTCNFLALFKGSP